MGIATLALVVILGSKGNEVNCLGLNLLCLGRVIVQSSALVTSAGIAEQLKLEVEVELGVSEYGACSNFTLVSLEP